MPWEFTTRSHCYPDSGARACSVCSLDKIWLWRISYCPWEILIHSGNHQCWNVCGGIVTQEFLFAVTLLNVQFFYRLLHDVGWWNVWARYHNWKKNKISWPITQKSLPMQLPKLSALWQTAGVHCLLWYTVQIPRPLWLGFLWPFLMVEPKGNYTYHLDVESF